MAHVFSEPGIASTIEASRKPVTTGTSKIGPTRPNYSTVPSTSIRPIRKQVSLDPAPMSASGLHMFNITSAGDAMGAGTTTTVQAGAINSKVPSVSLMQTFTAGTTNKTVSTASVQRVRYDPRTTVFSSMKDIPLELLSAVAACYEQRLLVCRLCFFESDINDIILRNELKDECQKGHPWKQLRVIPHCDLCILPTSFHANFIPIPPLPKHMQRSSAPFKVCNKDEHKVCQFMSKTNDPWFPHTVEELVIWTVEREKRELKYSH